MSSSQRTSFVLVTVLVYYRLLSLAQELGLSRASYGDRRFGQTGRLTDDYILLKEYIS
jgi:hypothetical protein